MILFIKEFFHVRAHFAEHGNEGFQFLCFYISEKGIGRVQGGSGHFPLETTPERGEFYVVLSPVAGIVFPVKQTFFFQIVYEFGNGVFVLFYEVRYGLLGEGAFVPKQIHDKILLRSKVDAFGSKLFYKALFNQTMNLIEIDADLLA